MSGKAGCGSAGLGQFPVGQILLCGAAAHGGLDIVSARRNGVSAPYAARPSPGIEKFRIRFDDPVRVHRLGARGIRAIRNPLRRPKEWEIRQAAAIRRETADDNRSDFGAGIQGENRAGRRIKPLPDAETEDARDIDGYHAGYPEPDPVLRRGVIVGAGGLALRVSPSSSWASSSTGTDTLFDVSPGAKVSAPEVAV